MSIAEENERIIEVFSAFLRYNGANIPSNALKRLNFYNISNWSLKNINTSSEELTSLTTFVYLAVIHQACLFNNNENDLQKYMLSVSKVKIRDQVYFKVEEALANFLNKNQDLFLDIQSQKLNSLSDKDITNILLFHTLSKIGKDDIQTKMVLNNLFSENSEMTITNLLNIFYVKDDKKFLFIQ